MKTLNNERGAVLITTVLIDCDNHPSSGLGTINTATSMTHRISEATKRSSMVFWGAEAMVDLVLPVIRGHPSQRGSVRPRTDRDHYKS